MATQSTQGREATTPQAEWSIRRWVAVNAAALGAAYGLAALFAGSAQALGAGYPSLVRDLSMFAGFLTGAVLFALLRQRTLLPHVNRARRVAIAAGVSLIAAVALGYGSGGGPPVYFVLGILAIGTVGGAVEWRALRDAVERPGVSLGRRAAVWLVAGVAGVATVILFDIAGAAAALDDALRTALGDAMGDVVHFAMMWSIIGLAGGAVGGALEGRALRRRIAPG
jgi:hypothetical protein